MSSNIEVVLSEKKHENAMTEYEKMCNNMPYDYTDPEIQARIRHTYEAMRALNQCGAWDMDECRRCTKALLPNAHPSALVIPPSA